MSDTTTWQSQLHTTRMEREKEFHDAENAAMAFGQLANATVVSVIIISCHVVLDDAECVMS